MSHISPSLKCRYGCEWAIGCKIWGVTPDGETCPTFPDPDDCPTYRRLLISEGELQIAGWEFNPFGLCQRICDLNPENCGHCSEPLQCNQWRDFWERIEHEWAEQFKFDTFYGDEDPDQETCPECGLVGSCMCDMLMQEQLDPEGLGLDDGGDIW